MKDFTVEREIDPIKNLKELFDPDRRRSRWYRVTNSTNMKRHIPDTDRRMISNSFNINSFLHYKEKNFVDSS